MRKILWAIAGLLSILGLILLVAAGGDPHATVSRMAGVPIGAGAVALGLSFLALALVLFGIGAGIRPEIAGGDQHREQVARLTKDYRETSTTIDTKVCPYCAETIKMAAIKCRFCGSALTVPGNEGATVYHGVSGTQSQDATDQNRVDTVVPAMDERKDRHLSNALPSIPTEPTAAAFVRMDAPPERLNYRTRWPRWLATGLVMLCLTGGAYYLWQREKQATAQQAAAEKARTDAALRKMHAKPQPQSRDCPQCPEMVRIPPGSFMMGAASGELAREGVPKEWRNQELPRHKVTIGYDFSLSKYEVTRGEFAFFVQWRGHRAARDWHDPGFAQTDQHPVVNVSWNDAKEYVAWLSLMTGQKYRLPSEAEWEYAARAGSTTARYWGEGHQEACAFANVLASAHQCDDGYPYTAPVGTFKANAFGLHDMLGNVWEWMEDCWNESYVGAPVDGTAWSRSDCRQHVVRGGAWINGPELVRAAARSGNVYGGEPNHRLGFRVARTD